jgi:hypothetical protein
MNNGINFQLCSYSEAVPGQHGYSGMGIWAVPAIVK